MNSSNPSETVPTLRTDLGRFAAFVKANAAMGVLCVQPRMGFSDFATMRRGLEAVRAADAMTIGTITLDSFTRVNDHESARKATDAGEDLNGYPLVAYGAETTRQLIDGVISQAFPVQVRHGSALPQEIFETLLAAGMDATEGGPISYCLPYSRVPLRHSIEAWTVCCELLAAEQERGVTCHLESFGGCMLGQLCPPALLVALTILEGIFFKRLGVASVSVSYAQQTNQAQDLQAVAALRRLANQHLTEVDWHVVIYTYMGLFPSTFAGAERILDGSVELAVGSKSERLIVKTPAEAHRIPTIEENVASLERAARVAERAAHGQLDSQLEETDSEIYEQARYLVEMVLDLSADLGDGLASAFERGYLDVPFCLHPDNANAARTYVDGAGALQWGSLGRVPLPRSLVPAPPDPYRVDAMDLLRMLAYNQQRFDRVLPSRHTNEVEAS